MIYIDVCLCTVLWFGPSLGRIIPVVCERLSGRRVLVERVCQEPSPRQSRRELAAAV